MELSGLFSLGLCLCFLSQCVAATYPACGSAPASANRVVSLQKRLKFDRNGPNYFHECTGSIIAAKWVLTAANCFNGYKQDKPELWQAVANEYDLREVSGNEQAVKVKRVIRYPGFHGRPSPSDVALVELATPLSFSGGVAAPVCLPGTGAAEADALQSAECLFRGWGLDMPDKYDPKLQQAGGSPMGPDSCRQHYGDAALKGVCVGGDVVTGLCRDDVNAFVKPWGSPLLCRTDDGAFVQVALLNWADDVQPRTCEDPQVPGLFTKTSAVREWIYEIAKV